ncbi:MAG: type II toxin-antitoxin system HicB family antitoxin [Elusimicrobia bacterium]|nr:type II toxin-antitoxin system HicB family antitoxin [Candidatus Obscuribacterium magneticum]
MKRKFQFPVIIEQDEDGWYVGIVPDLKGCHTQAKTLPQLEKRIREAIQLCLSIEKGRVHQNKFVGIHQLEVVFG